MILIFEKQKLLDVKTILQNIILIQLKQHTSSIELLSAAYQDLTEIDEEQDLKVNKCRIRMHGVFNIFKINIFFISLRNFNWKLRKLTGYLNE